MKLFTLLLLILSSLSIFAGGVKMKKAINEGAKKIELAIADLNKSCESSAIGNSKHGDAGDLKIEGREPENLVSVSANICADYLSNISSLCKDQDYKQVIKKFKTITCIPSISVEKETGKSTYEIKGTTLVITHHPTFMGGADAYTKLENSL
ncbi:MAG: hypothetical protein K9K67_14970 [Bacteriovoracaceae bacterium]|nr:hypothetical protein [Bacteriovoracaceae bacterium]